MDKPELLFILGAPKTASSSLCAMLNSYSNIFIMYEVELYNYRMGKYARQIVQDYPEMAKFFSNKTSDNSLLSYHNAANYFGHKNPNLKYFGDKIVDLTQGYYQNFENSKVIFSTRYLPEWLAKNSIRKLYASDKDIVPLAVQFSKHFLESFFLKNVYYVRLRDIIEDNSKVVRELNKFLELEPGSIKENWWLSVGKYKAKDPKSQIKWWRGHPSSLIKPMRKDTFVKLNKRHGFWDEIMPVFEKYFFAVEKYNNGERLFSHEEIQEDIKFLDGLVNKYSLSIKKAYKEITSKNLGVEKPSFLKRLAFFGKQAIVAYA